MSFKDPTLPTQLLNSTDKVFCISFPLFLILMKKSTCFSPLNTAKNTVISPDSLVWKFCGKGQFPHSFGRIARNYAETVPFPKISTPGNQVKLQYFSQ